VSVSKGLLVRVDWRLPLVRMGCRLPLLVRVDWRLGLVFRGWRVTGLARSVEVVELVCGGGPSSSTKKVGSGAAWESGE